MYIEMNTCFTVLFVDVITLVYGVLYPQSQVVYKGGTIYIQCDSSTPPRWTKNGMSVLSDPSLVPLSLVLYNVNEDHNGNYVCHGTTTISIPFKEQAEVFVGGS